MVDFHKGNKVASECIWTESSLSGLCTLLSDTGDFSGWTVLWFYSYWDDIHGVIIYVKVKKAKQPNISCFEKGKSKTEALESILANILAASLTKELIVANEVELASSQTIKHVNRPHSV